MIGLNKGFLWWDVKKKCQTPGTKMRNLSIKTGKTKFLKKNEKMC